MRIAVLGAGFTGLAAAYYLLKKGHDVTIFEKEETLGGLAIGFSNPNWNWTLEKAYHHWFTNDITILKLARELYFPVITKRPSTDVFIKEKRLPFDNPLSLLTFPYLSFPDKLKMGLSIIYLKIVNNYEIFEGQKAYNWIKKSMGEKATELIWDSLLSGKFGKFKEEIALTWFWARIKKRTPSLAYPEGGFKVFAEKIGSQIKQLGGHIFLNHTVTSLESKEGKVRILTGKDLLEFDEVIVTLPSPIFTKITKGLPERYSQRINSIPHLHAQILILVLKKPLMDKTYWLNITDKNFPFLVLAEHTNFMDPKNYGGNHILYIGNYLPPDHPYLKMTAKELLKMFDPYLKKINPLYHLSLITYHLFIGPFAQPVVTVDYPKLMPDFKTPLEGIYLANLDMVYPWDRGTNYAVELGEKVARIILKNES